MLNKNLQYFACILHHAYHMHICMNVTWLRIKIILSITILRHLGVHYWVLVTPFRVGFACVTPFRGIKIVFCFTPFRVHFRGAWMRMCTRLVCSLTPPGLVHAFVTSRLDSNNSMLFGLPQCELAKIQRVQNTAARLVLCVPRREHITPFLRKLHWLPIECRALYKILLLK